MSNDYSTPWKLFILESSIEGASSGSAPKKVNEPVYDENGNKVNSKMFTSYEKGMVHQGTTKEIPINRNLHGFLFVIKRPEGKKPYELIRYYPATGEWKFVGESGIVFKSTRGLNAYEAAAVLRKQKIKIKRRVPGIDLGKL